MNFYELLLNRGQPAGEGMTHFERLFAAKLAGGEIKELEGVPPLLFKANGSPLISWRISGNTVQNGTPTPDNPIMPEGCGERTANLFDKNNNPTNNTGYTRPGVEVPVGTYSIDNGTSHHVYYRIGYSGIAQQTNPGMKTEGIVASDSLYV